MAGKKGRSGGSRSGSGPKKKPPVVDTESEPSAFLYRVMRGEIDPSTAQINAALALVRSEVRPVGGLRAKRQAAAEGIAEGSRFKPRPSPLKLVSGG